mgnify:CR=1 FL=1
MLYQKQTIYSIGYEGKTIEDFLELLRARRIDIILDIRANDYSRKPDFIGARLKKHCQNIGIDYRWIPDLGIPIKLRKDIKDREVLLHHYRNSILPLVSDKIKEIEDLIRTDKRVALVCMESNPLECHRSIITDYLTSRSKSKVEHIQ